jgi:hypothetical protein
MPRAWSRKRARQYEHINEDELERGKRAVERRKAKR